MNTPQLTPAQEALDDFQRAFILSGTRVEFNRAGRLILPFVNSRSYEVVFEPETCATCADLEVWYIPGGVQHCSEFYSICHEHRLKLLGRAIRCQRPKSAEATHNRRKSGATTTRWYQDRGW